MSDNSAIEWTDATWNPVTGCEKVSPGCDHCYAETFAERWRGTPGHYFEQGFDVTLRPGRLDEPLRWRKPRRIFVNSMSDLFHDDVPDEFIARVFAVMALAQRHTFQVLTKRHGRMRSLFNSRNWRGSVAGQVRLLRPDQPLAEFDALTMPFIGGEGLPNIWLGVSVEDQKRADLRVPALIDTPASVRFLSCEPLLGPVDISRWVSALDWVIVGGESGPGARPMRPEWAHDLRDQCTAAGARFFFKQWGAWCPPHQDFGQSIYDHVTNEDACQVVSSSGALLGRPWPGWRFQDGSRDGVVMRRYPKGAAGRVLDGRTWDEMPEPAGVLA